MAFANEGHKKSTKESVKRNLQESLLETAVITEIANESSIQAEDHLDRGNIFLQTCCADAMILSFQE